MFTPSHVSFTVVKSNTENCIKIKSNQSNQNLFAEKTSNTDITSSDSS